MKIAISNCLNMANASEKRRAVDSAVLAYYAGLSIKGHELSLVAVGSSKKDRDAAEAHGWDYVEAPNDNVGAKRNTGMQRAIDSGADIVFRIGSDDILSPALINEVARRAEIGHEGYWELRGFYIYDVPSGKLALHRLKQFALAFMPEKVKPHLEEGKTLYNEDGSTIDSGIDIRLRSWCYPWYMLKACEAFPMIALKSGDEINSFERAIQLEPLLHEFVDNPQLVFTHFPGFNLTPSTLSGKSADGQSAKRTRKASNKKVNDDAKSTAN